MLVTQSVKDLKTSEDGTGFGTVFAFLKILKQGYLGTFTVEDDECHVLGLKIKQWTMYLL